MVQRCRAWRYLGLGELTHRVAQRINVFTKLKIKTGHVHEKSFSCELALVGLRVTTMRLPKAYDYLR